jgi:ubiquinone/menaquinone biosynthesis C-methylase UbiE
VSNKSFYENFYTHFDSESHRWRDRSGEVKAHNIMTLAGDVSMNNVIEIGSGSGAVLATLAQAKFGVHYWAVDISEEAIELVRCRDDIPGLVEARVFDGDHIPYQDQLFDLAILSHVLEHLTDPARLLLEAARVARYVAVEVPLEANIYTYLKVRVFKSDYRQRIGHIQWFSKSNFRELIERTCGLEIVRLQMAYVPDDLYFIRKQGTARIFTSLLVGLRKILRTVSTSVYSRTLTDHCIAFIRSRS